MVFSNGRMRCLVQKQKKKPVRQTDRTGEERGRWFPSLVQRTSEVLKFAGGTLPAGLFRTAVPGILNAWLDCKSIRTERIAYWSIHSCRDAHTHTDTNTHKDDHSRLRTNESAALVILTLTVVHTRQFSSICFEIIHFWHVAVAWGYRAREEGGCYVRTTLDSRLQFPWPSEYRPVRENLSAFYYF